MFEFDMVQSGLGVLALMVLGEYISGKTKAIAPSILIAGVLFLALEWAGILPADLVGRSGLINIAPVCMMFIIITMGASTNFRQLLDNWRVVALAAMSFAFQLLVIFLVIGGLFGRNMAVGSLPGGSAVALIVQERASQLGYEHIAALSVLLLSTQGMVAGPIVSWLLRLEVKRLRDAGRLSAANSAVADGAVLKPEKAKSSQYPAILRLYLMAWLASRIEMLTGISRYVLCLLLGVLFGELKFLKKNEMELSQSSGFFFLVLMSMVLNGLSGTTPDMFISLLLPLVCVLAADLAAISVFTILAGGFFGFSKYLSFALGLNVMVGFPLNMMISRDMIEYLVKDEDERGACDELVTNRMVIAGFTSTTFLCTLAAGLLVGLMK